MSNSADWAQAIISLLAFGGLIYTIILQKRSIDKLSDQVAVLQEQLDLEKTRTNRIMEPKFTAAPGCQIINGNISRDSEKREYTNLDLVNNGSDVYNLQLANNDSEHITCVLQQDYVMRGKEIGIHIRTARSQDELKNLLPISFKIFYSTIMGERNFVIVKIESIKPERIKLTYSIDT